VTGVRDNLAGVDVTRVRWPEDDALAFSLRVSPVNGITSTVARGNLLLADHGQHVRDTQRTTDALATGNRVGRFALERGPLSFRAKLDTTGPAVLATRVDPHGATPQVSVKSGTDDWTIVPTLLRSGAFDRDLVVETGDDGRALLRFGDNVLGTAADPDAAFDVTYRIGIGVEGNIGADVIQHVIENPDLPIALSGLVDGIRNPLPAWGGIGPESIAAVKNAAPAAFRARQERAVTETDYAQIAERMPVVRRAVARFRWTGSWHTVFISIDPAGREGLEESSARDIRRFVENYTQAGYDLEIVPPHYVPLSIGLVICVSPNHFRPDVESAVRQALTSGYRSHGQLGFFHPDNFTFGQPLYLSRLYAAIADIDGVDSVVASKFARLFDDEPDAGGSFTTKNLDRGAIPIGPIEIARLDDDPDFPENGLLRLTMQGGK
jgi:hypothetical protein